MNKMYIRRYKQEYNQALKDIFKTIYPSNPRLQENNYLNWQFRDNPYNKDNDYTIWILEDSSQIKGFYGWIPVELFLKGRYSKSCEPILWWTADDAKGHGIQLLGNIIQKFPINLFHGCNQQSFEVFKQFDIPCFSLSRFIGIIDLQYVASIFKIKLTENFNNDSKRLKKISEKANLDSISLINRFETNEEMTFDSFKELEARLRYTSNYLNWRYVDIPECNYQIIKGTKHGEYCIFRIEKIKHYDVSVMRIIECSFGPDTIQNAIGFLFQESFKNNVILMDFFCSYKKIGNLFEQHGFGSCDKQYYNIIPYLFRPICNSMELIICINGNGTTINDKKWYITKGNGDMDRVKL